ncbi:hypothetical protein [Roseateles puraquae]|uniref:Uncharacterized protein n=1 Tax=Roseateles puraquae TaxID=431059 RepID=A0A254N9M5_9BURK|nr:hypothetical protein [Roseateles puraquae]MDG0853003.1 hypothetical protein [Roseateles puraquae]OWR02128.1 hypothetical protein CDO81_20510 [Roseateles puraquae]
MTSPDDTPGWLRPARTEFARLHPDAAREAALLAELTRQLKPRPARTATAQDEEPAGEPRWFRRLAWGSGALGAAAAVLLTTLLLLDPPGSQTAHAAPADGPGSGFIPVVPEAEFRAALAGDRPTPVWLQPAELPRERLAWLGLPFDASRADETVRAELLVNPSGQVLAVRILN